MRAHEDRESALLEAAVCFRFGDYHVERLVDTDGNDYGWIIKKNGKWEQNEKLTRDEAIARVKALISVEKIK